MGGCSEGGRRATAVRAWSYAACGGKPDGRRSPREPPDTLDLFRDDRDLQSLARRVGNVLPHLHTRDWTSRRRTHLVHPSPPGHGVPVRLVAAGAGHGPRRRGDRARGLSEAPRPWNLTALAKFRVQPRETALDDPMHKVRDRLHR